MLCELPAPLGGLFVWMEGQLHEHGPLNWTALRDELAGQSFQERALQLMDGPTAPSSHSKEAALDLSDVLKRLAIDRITTQMNGLAAAISDPEVQHRYRSLELRKKSLTDELELLKMV